MQIGEFVLKPAGAEFLGPAVGGKRHVEFVEFDERVGQTHGGRPPRLHLCQGFFKGLQGLLAPPKMHVKRPQVNQGGGARRFVSALQPFFHQFLGRVKVVQRQQRGVVHFVHGVRFVVFPERFEVELGLGVAPFVVVILCEFQVGLGGKGLGGNHPCTQGDERAHPHSSDPRHGCAWICCAHSARLATIKLSMRGRVAPSNVVPNDTKRAVSATAWVHCATTSSSRAT